ncbi:MAG: hypothetical protein WKF84_09835 [Pyrinomonadaceae bacterium]
MRFDHGHMGVAIADVAGKENIGCVVDVQFAGVASKETARRRKVSLCTSLSAIAQLTASLSAA